VGARASPGCASVPPASCLRGEDALAERERPLGARGSCPRRVSEGRMPSLSAGVPWVRGRPLGARAYPPALCLRGQDALAGSAGVPWVRGRPLGARASPPASRLRGQDALAGSAGVPWVRGRPLGARASPPASRLRGEDALALGRSVMEIEHLIRYAPLAVGLKPSARQGKARLRGLERNNYSKTISPRLSRAKPACAG